MEHCLTNCISTSFCLTRAVSNYLINSVQGQQGWGKGYGERTELRSSIVSSQSLCIFFMAKGLSTETHLN